MADNPGMDQEQSLRRFGADFVAAHQERYGRCPPERRELSYDLAVEDQYEPWRVWLDDQFALLPSGKADELAGKLWYDQHFWPVMHELVAGAQLRGPEVEAVYEQEWNGLTPDWTVVSAEDGRPLAVVEVHSESPDRRAFGQMRSWHDLATRIRKIPVSLVLALKPTGGPISPPDPRTAKRIAQDLRRYLMQPLAINEIPSNGYTFLVQGDRNTGTLMTSPLGMATYLATPSSIAGVVTAQPLAGRVGDKVSKYRQLAAEGIPLVVAVGAHRFTGLKVEHLDHLLTGQMTMTIQFDFGDVYFGDPVEVDMGRPSRWSMPEGLAGILWLDNQLPFGAAWRPNPHARTPVPPTLGQRWAAGVHPAAASPILSASVSEG